MSKSLHDIYEKAMLLKNKWDPLLAVTNTKIVQAISAAIVKNMIEA